MKTATEMAPGQRIRYLPKGVNRRNEYCLSPEGIVCGYLPKRSGNFLTKMGMGISERREKLIGFTQTPNRFYAHAAIPEHQIDRQVNCLYRLQHRSSPLTLSGMMARKWQVTEMAGAKNIIRCPKTDGSYPKSFPRLIGIPLT